MGVHDASDFEILAYAVAKSLIVFTNDLDFGAILAATGLNSPSVIQLRERELTPKVLGAAVLSEITAHSEE